MRVGKFYDVLCVWQDVLLAAAVSELIEQVAYLLEVELEQFVLEDAEDDKWHLEEEHDALDEQVVPDADAEAEWEGREEERPKPALDPEGRRKRDFVEVGLDMRQVLLEQVVELELELHEQRELGRVEALESAVEGFPHIIVRVLFSDCYEEPECLFVVSAVDEEE